VGLGPIHNGNPGLDVQFTWCDECWLDLMSKRMPAGLAKELPPGTLVPFTPEPLSVLEYNSAARVEHKVLATEAKSVATITAVSQTSTGDGSFSGYLAAYGRDHMGDTIQPGAMDETASALNSGAIQWHLTDAHSDLASDVVATVTAAAVDQRGLRIEGRWMPTERAQALRKMVRNGARLGLSIDYLVDASRPDGKGGRLLDLITVVGGAVTPKPMNAAAMITEGKAGASVPVVDWCADVQARSERNDPQRLAEDRLLAACDWPPRHWDRDTRLSIIRSSAEAKARREFQSDPQRESERVRQRRQEQNNRYSDGLRAWMEAAKAAGRCGSCGQCGYGGRCSMFA
jgi:hypothetical protein